MITVKNGQKYSVPSKPLTRGPAFLTYDQPTVQITNNKSCFLVYLINVVLLHLLQYGSFFYSNLGQPIFLSFLLKDSLAVFFSILGSVYFPFTSTKRQSISLLF